MSTRDKILDAAADVIGDQGLVRATTKEIAKAAGYSEATLYKHFDNKTAMFTAVLAERSPGDLGAALRRLHERGEKAGLMSALEDVAVAAVGFYRQGFPLAASLFAEPELLAAHRAELHSRDAGPHRPVEALAAYLTECRDRGEIAESARSARRRGDVAGGMLPAGLSDPLLASRRHPRDHRKLCRSGRGKPDERHHTDIEPVSRSERSGRFLRTRQRAAINRTSWTA